MLHTVGVTLRETLKEGERTLVGEPEREGRGLTVGEEQTVGVIEVGGERVEEGEASVLPLRRAEDDNEADTEADPV